MRSGAIALSPARAGENCGSDAISGLDIQAKPIACKLAMEDQCADSRLTATAQQVKRTKMRIPGLWRPEVRGNVLRKEYEDLKRRIDATDSLPKSTFFNFIRSTFGPVSEGYTLASSADRQRILKEVRDVSRKLWEAGNRPQALALGVIMLNIESEFVPGEDAAFVKEATDALIKKAMA
jgi:hypothetical protein